MFKHKWYVLIAGLKFKVPLWRLIIHDWSKFRYWTEWKPYRELFYELATKESREAFQMASMRHIKLNKHHWNYWVQVTAGIPKSLTANPESHRVRVHEMPEIYIREMVADWYGAGKAVRGTWSARDWYEDHKDSILLAPTTRAMVEQFLSIDFERV